MATPEILDPADANLFQTETRRPEPAGFHAALCSDKQHLDAPSRQTSRATAIAGITWPPVPPPAITNSSVRIHPACSETFSRIPSDASVTSSELPPKLIIGSGMPFVGTMPSTTLILKNAWITSIVVMPSAR